MVKAVQKKTLVVAGEICDELVDKDLPLHSDWFTEVATLGLYRIPCSW